MFKLADHMPHWFVQQRSDNFEKIFEKKLDFSLVLFLSGNAFVYYFINNLDKCQKSVTAENSSLFSPSGGNYSTGKFTRQHSY